MALTASTRATTTAYDSCYLHLTRAYCFGYGFNYGSLDLQFARRYCCRGLLLPCATLSCCLGWSPVVKKRGRKTSVAAVRCFETKTMGVVPLNVGYS